LRNLWQFHLTLFYCKAKSLAPSITPERAADLTAEFNNLLEKATPLIERYRYLYADPFTFLSELEAQAHPDVSGE